MLKISRFSARAHGEAVGPEAAVQRVDAAAAEVQAAGVGLRVENGHGSPIISFTTLALDLTFVVGLIPSSGKEDAVAVRAFNKVAFAVIIPSPAAELAEFGHSRTRREIIAKGFTGLVIVEIPLRVLGCPQSPGREAEVDPRNGIGIEQLAVSKCLFNFFFQSSQRFASGLDAGCQVKQLVFLCFAHNSKY